MAIEIVRLSKTLLTHSLERLLEIDAGTLGEDWSPVHFEMDLPNKWKISRAVLSEGKIVGFLIASQKDERFHIHRLAVQYDFRSRGVGQRLVKDLIDQARVDGVGFITLKVQENNASAIRFYAHLNFRITLKQGTNFHMVFNF